VHRLQFVLFVLIALTLAGCRGSHEPQRLAGAVVFVDAAGNRMVVDNRGAPAAQQAEQPVAAESPRLPESLPRSRFQGDDFVDSDALMQELEQKESQRFYVIPDGIGGRQMVEAGTLGIGAVPPPEPPAPAVAAQWRVCRVIVPLVELKPAKRYDLRFPAEDARGIARAGFRLRAPAGARRVELETFIRAGTSAVPLLARLDAQGRVLSIVNNLPTQSIPESVFRYASVIAGTELIAGGGADYAVLDAAVLQGRLPAECGLQVRERPGSGQVTVQFSGSDDE